MCLEQALIDFETYSKSHNNNLICLHEANGTYLHVGESSKNVTGFETEELVGKNPYDYFHPDDHERIHDVALAQVRSHIGQLAQGHTRHAGDA